MTVFLLSSLAGSVWTDNSTGFEGPRFVSPITNVTVSMNRDAVLHCVVANLSIYKVAWLRVDTQTILTIETHVITKNRRITITHTDHKSWHLHIHDVRETDRGAYMCQINTEPMKSQTGYLEVVVPPDILDNSTSTDMVIREGTNVTLRCAAAGLPTPNITWRREDGETIRLSNGEEVRNVNGSVFNITKINRMQMGGYLCIASNGVPPTVSKRIMLTVHFPPTIYIQNQLVGSKEGQDMTLECNSEAFPRSLHYWKKENNETIESGAKYNLSQTISTYKVHMLLTILSVRMTDYGTYKCISRNSIGETDGTITLYHIPSPTTELKTTTTTPIPTIQEVENIQNSRQRPFPGAELGPDQKSDSSLPNMIRNDDIRLHGRASSDGYNAKNDAATKGQKSIDNEVRPRRIDNTAQSMSSRGSGSNILAQSRAAICIILLSALS
ncbi:opioid-binding protein/cell adhesion molecule homolog [Colletes gigas]|uniref:opioid-binding protein/cell adhesion molecule homolog n=1 Tax=Colletes gigas TaxID=935657 RepID=UPI001C9A6F05|nr:opioid-binding protein/cell adhesion molecule homolog [Colletes gigas]